MRQSPLPPIAAFSEASIPQARPNLGQLDQAAAVPGGGVPRGVPRGIGLILPPLCGPMRAGLHPAMPRAGRAGLLQADVHTGTVSGQPLGRGEQPEVSGGGPQRLPVIADER